LFYVYRLFKKGIGVPKEIFFWNNGFACVEPWKTPEA